MINRFSILAGGAALLLMTGGQGFAAGAGAYRVEVTDAMAVSIAGAFVGLANSPAAVFYNPAGMTQMKQSEASLGVALIQPKESAKPTNGDKTKMQRDTFLIPTTAVVMPVTQNISLGFGATSFWGLSTGWSQDSFARYVATSTTLKNEDYVAALAYRLNDSFSMGLGLIIDQSSVQKEKKITQAGVVPDANFKLQGDNTAAGFQVSGLYKINERHQVGVQYSSDIRRKYHGKIHLDDLNNAVLSAVYGFNPNFTSSSYETDVVSKATLPQSVDIGYCYRPVEKWTFSVDFMWMDWGSIKEEELAYPNETDPARLTFLNLGNPANRDWHSTLSLGLGTEYAMSDRLRLRGGYYFHQSPVPQDTWDPSLPDADSHSLATGFGYDITRSLTLDMAYSAMFYNTRSVSNGVGDASGGPIDGKYRQRIYLVLATMTYKF